MNLRIGVYGLLALGLFGIAIALTVKADIITGLVSLLLAAGFAFMGYREYKRGKK